MALSVFYTPRWRAIDANGNPMNGAVLKFFEAGTSTPLPVYADVDGNTELGVTVTADGAGLFAEIFMAAQAYKVELYTTAGVLVWSADDFFPPQVASAAGVTLLAVAGVTFAAGETAYMSDGSGALNAGQMYKGDADLEYASSTPFVYFAVAAITAGNTGLFVSEGVVTGLSGLTPGALYYLSGTAGAIQTTPGTFQRLVGQARSTTELAVATNPPIGTSVLTLIEPLIKSLVNGRLTLTSGVPVTTSDVLAATTLYFTPYQGNQIGAYTGSAWVVETFAELSIAVPATTNQMYDVFFDYNDGTPQLALTAWTNDTTRATALVLQNGVWVKTGDTQQRYLGSFRTTAVIGQTEDSFAKRYVWNYYNRVRRGLRVIEATNSWTYTTAAWQQANASAANQVDVVVGVAEVLIALQVMGWTLNASTTGVSGVGIGEDSASALATGLIGGAQTNVTTLQHQVSAWLHKMPAVGRHFYAWLEYGSGSSADTWFGDNGATIGQSGLSGWIEG